MRTNALLEALFAVCTLFVRLPSIIEKLNKDKHEKRMNFSAIDLHNELENLEHGKHPGLYCSVNALKNGLVIAQKVSDEDNKLENVLKPYTEYLVLNKSVYHQHDSIQTMNWKGFLGTNRVRYYNYNVLTVLNSKDNRNKPLDLSKSIDSNNLSQ